MCENIKINKKFIHEFSWSNLSKIFFDANDKRLYDPNFRIVHLTNCPSTSDFQKTLLGDDRFKELLIESEYLFCLIVNVETIDEEALVSLSNIYDKILKNSGKHFLIEFYSKSFDNFVRFTFKNRNVTPFSHLDNGYKCRGETENDEWPNVSEISKTSLMNLKIDIAAYKIIINHAAKEGNFLLIRILKSFEIIIEQRIERDILKDSVSNGNHQLFRAYLELPIIEKNSDNSIAPNIYTRRILKINFHGNSLLSFAAQNGDLDIVKLLLRLGCDVNQELSDGTVSDYCGSHYEVLLFLLNNDAKFPNNFFKESEKFQNSLGCKGVIYAIKNERDELHAAIESNNEKGIMEFREKYPNLRMAYMCIDKEPYNRTATMTALTKAMQNDDEEHAYYKLYAFLFSNGFRDDYDEIEQLPIGRCEEIRRVLVNELKNNQPAYIEFLRNKTKIGTVDGTERTYGKKVDELYKYLGEHPDKDLHTILKVLEHSQNLTIIIDFHSRFLDPICTSMKKTDGITLPMEGYIYIGAGKRKLEKVASTLVHELSHYACLVTFNNAFNPYYKEDEENKKIMSEITQKISKIYIESKKKVISKVFAYAKSEWNRELIVRVPELITLGERDFFADGEYKELFDFFNDKVLSVIKRIIDEPEHFRLKKELEQLNSDLGLVDQIKSFRLRGIWPKETQLPNNGDSLLLVSPTPNLLLADIFINLIKPTLISSKPNDKTQKGYCFILASLYHMESQNLKSRIVRLWESSNKVTLILYCRNEIVSESLQKELKKISEKRNIILVGSYEKYLKTIDPKLPSVSVQYSWTDIDPKNIEILFQKEILFQGKNVALKNLIGADCSVITLDHLVNDRPIEVKPFKVLIDNYDHLQYVGRRFQTYETVENLLSAISVGRKTFLLSGDSGCGKSIIFSWLQMKIKENQPDVWLSRINLHEWGETFQSVETEDPIDLLSNILVQTTDETDRKFQRLLFRKLYENSKVIILFDAYDELGVEYRTTFKNLIKNISQNVQMWISTRPQFIEALTQYLIENFVSLKLTEFSIDNATECATKCWQKNIPNLDGEKSEFYQKYIRNPNIESKLKQFATTMFEQISGSTKHPIFVNFFLQPAIVVTFAEYYQEFIKNIIFSESNDFTIVPYVDIFDIYKMIVAKKNLVVYREKGSKIATELAVDSLFREAPNYLEHLSLKSRYGPSSSVVNADFKIVKYTYEDLMNFDENTLNGLFQRSGLISIADKSYGYPHEIDLTDQSICDYLVAVFILRALRNVTKSTINDAKFDTAMKVLCMNVINPCQDNRTVIAFIDKGLKTFWWTLDENIHVHIYNYFTETKRITFEFNKSNFLQYLLDERAIFLLTFIMKCFLQQYPAPDSPPRPIVFNIADADILHEIASKAGIFSVVELFWNNHKLRESITSERIRTAFRSAFLYFPDNKIAAIRDNSGMTDAQIAFQNTSKFDDRLKTIIAKNFDNSTLYNLSAMCDPDQDGEHLLLVRDRDLVNEYNNRVSVSSTYYDGEFPLDCAWPSLKQEYMDSLIAPEDFQSEADFVLDVDFVEAYLEMKWAVMERFGYRATNWNEVVTNTLFRAVVQKIFWNFESNAILKFYKWARSKTFLLDSFTDFVTDTIVKLFPRCEVRPGIDEIFQFIRETLGMNLETVYQDRNLEDYFEKFSTFLPTCKKFFTQKEFIAFLICRDVGSKSIFQHFLNNKSETLINILVALRHLGTIDIEIKQILQKFCNFTAPYHDDILQTINISIFYLLEKPHEANFDLTMSSFEHIFGFGDSLKMAFQSTIPGGEYECTIFHRACRCRDISVLNKVWQKAKSLQLTDEELRKLLSLKNDQGRRTIIKENDQRFIEHPPTIHNTYCEAPAYQFLPFNRKNDERPKYAVEFKVDQDRFTCIGRRVDRDDYPLCQIFYRGSNLDEIKPIPYDRNIDLTDVNIEILTGKGMTWLEPRENGRRFVYNLSELWINQSGQITMESRDKRSGYFDLGYSSSFEDDSNSEMNIYCKPDFGRKLRDKLRRS